MTLGVKPRQHLLGVHPQLDQLDRDLAADWFGLLSHPDGTHPAFPNPLQQSITAGNHRASQVRVKLRAVHRCRRLQIGYRFGLRQAARLVVSGKQGIDPLTQLTVLAAGPIQIVGAILG
ncbi:MAG: hypothetical protein U0795_01545 [Pirellulales bacterium]